MFATLHRVHILHYLEFESQLTRSGIGTAARQQRAALEKMDVTYETDVRLLGNGLSRLHQYDLIHCNFIGPVTCGIVKAGQRYGIPVILHAHVTKEDFAESFRGSTKIAPVLGRYLKWLYSQADLLVCPSQYTKETIATYPVSTAIQSISNGVQFEKFQQISDLRDTYRTNYSLNGSVVTTVGNVFERKGLEMFLELARSTPYQYVWFGPYDRGIFASSQVRNAVNNPPENVQFTGWIEDIRGAYAAGDIFCFPSRTENQGLAVLEAMASGKPVVLRDIPVFNEYYTDGYDCIMCSTIDEFREALTRLAGNPSLRENLGMRAKKTAKLHTIEKLAEDLRDSYEAVLADVT